MLYATWILFIINIQKRIVNAKNMASMFILLHFIFMDILIEEKNKDLFTKGIKTVLDQKLDTLFFTCPPNQKNLLKYTHPLFRIMFMLEGEYAYKIYNKWAQRIQLSCGSVLFCQRRSMTQNVNHDKKFGTMLTLVFFPNFVRFLISKQDNAQQTRMNYWYHTHIPASSSEIYILNALNEYVLADDFDIKAQFLLKALLHDVLNNLKNDEKIKMSKSFQTYQKIKSYLYENSNQPINRESTAAKFDLSPSHISKLFANYDKHTFNSVLKQLRLEHALELLNSTDFSIGEIAEECGFVNTSFFIKNFKMQYSVSPGKFRQK